MRHSQVRHRLRQVMATLALVLSPTIPALAQAAPPPLVTDRPDQTESSVVVGPGLWQIEAGYGLSRFDFEGERTEVTAFPSTLVRYGLDPSVELRFGWQGYVNEELEVGGIDSDLSGSGDTSLGAKIHLREERKNAPQMALLLDVALPTGDSDFGSERIDPSARVLGSHTLNEKFGFGWNLGVAAETGADAFGDRDTFAVGIYTASLGMAVNDRWSSFVELFGAVPLSGPDAPANSVDAGATYRVRENLQLDFSAGAGLSEQAQDWFAGFGISLRLPR